MKGPKESKTVPRDHRLQIGRRIAGLREERGETQAQLAEHLGLTAQAIDRWEQGHTVPRQTALINLAEYYGVSAAWVMNGGTVARDTPDGVIHDEKWAAFIREAEEEGANPADLRRAWALYREALKHLPPQR